MTSSSAAVFRPGRPVTAAADIAGLRERSVRRRLTLVWGLLFLNAIGYTGALVHVPGVVGKLITQGALPVALLVAMTLNRRLVIRPNVFLCLVTLLPAGAIVTSLQPEYFGTVYRTFRLVEFVVALWLLTPFWGRRDMLLVRCHLVSLGVVLGSVVLGLLVAPGHALSTGRLAGALWDIPATQVAHYAAVTFGLVVLMWMSGRLRGKVALMIVAATASVLVLTHTRTALIAMIAALLVAGLSMITAVARVRKVFAAAGAIAGLAIMTLSGYLTTWLARGESTKELTDLTGRTMVWGPLLVFPRDRFQEIFGFGLSNDSFDGLPIDSNWLASYDAQGLLGVAICAAMLVFLLIASYFQPRGVQRALALFLVTYCLVASVTEVGFTDASPYLLELTLAASLLVPPPVKALGYEP